MKKVLKIKKYTDKEGNEKTSFRQVGTIFPTKNGNEIMELDMFDSTYLIKEEIKKQDTQEQGQDEIPF